MSDETPFARAVLDQLSGLRDDVGGVREQVQELRSEVAATYARESDCVSRASHEREARGESVARIWGAVEKLGERVDGHDGRIAAVERDGRDTATVRRVHSNLWKYLLGILAGVLVGVLVGWLRGRM